ncbi:hypothetical protein BGZ65_001693 [Modicella reniformis]|uniref:F-box domain-containing protein n=1 Tax=Modicella reniformis TaxID=1440133 RepID=A0A9P6M9Z4_9FUNG|nr:hypothetical protein BGZ65_001693 [Modicella reniformis]
MIRTAIINPLLLPEILHRVSDYVPCWKNQGGAFADCQFDPYDIIACSFVSRTWYNIFYPTLWTIYDGRAMARVSSRKKLNSNSSNNANNNNNTNNNLFTAVPEELLIAQSSRFRIFINNRPTRYNIFKPATAAAAGFQCRCLIDLTLYDTNPHSLHLLKSNVGGLKRLTWCGSIPFSGMLSDLEADVLLTLGGAVKVGREKGGGGGRLEALTLQQWDVSEGRLIRVLRQNARTLVHLTLKGIQGLDSLTWSKDEGEGEGQPSDETTLMRPKEAGDDNDNDNDEEEKIYEKKNGQQQQQAMVLDRLEDLTIDCEWAENQALLKFITECCPHLQTLNLSDSLLDNEAMIIRLEDRLTAQQLLQQKRMDPASGIQYILNRSFADES